MFYILLAMVVFLFPCGINGVHDSFKIFRSEHDIFTNLQCSGDECTESHCQMFGANCVSDGNCKYCICNKSGMNTFIRNETDPTKGECKRDEEIVPESVPTKRFLIQRQGHNQCIKALQNGSVIRTSCSLPTLDMLWIWTNTPYTLLMNIQTLKCMSGNLFHDWLRRRPQGDVRMQPCQENFNSQKMTCFSSQDRTRITIGWNRWTTNDRSVESRRYLHLSKNNYIVASRDKNQMWNNKKRACTSSTATYRGCYRFSDGSFMKYLHYNKTNPKLQIFGPIFQNNGHLCSVRRNFQFTRDGQIRSSYNAEEIFAIKNKFDGRREIKFTTTEHLKAWNGSLMKIFVKCGHEEHCVLLKLESYPKYSNVIHNYLPPQPESTGTDLSSVAVAVTVILVVILLFALGYFVYYKRRKREGMIQNSNNADPGTSNCSGQLCEEDQNRVYETLGENEREVLRDEHGNTSNTYSDPENNIVEKPTSTEHEYACAKDTNIPRNIDGKKPVHEEPNAPMYHTLEQPDQPTNDLYSYAYATNIAKPSSSEPEYTYARNTDTPKVTADKVVVPQTPANSAVYHTLEETPIANVYKTPGDNIPTEPEYTYAKDTDIPRTKENSASINSPLYHTIKEKNSAQAPAYSTLEGPDD